MKNGDWKIGKPSADKSLRKLFVILKVSTYEH